MLPLTLFFSFFLRSLFPNHEEKRYRLSESQASAPPQALCKDFILLFHPLPLKLFFLKFSITFSLSITFLKTITLSRSLTSFASSRQTGSRVVFSITEAKAYSGVRSLLFHHAASLGGFYNDATGAHESSFFYEGNNLQVNLFFGIVTYAAIFINKVGNDLKYFKFSKCRIENNHIPFESVLIAVGQLYPVCELHYVNMSQGSPFFNEEEEEVSTIPTSSTENSTMAKDRDDFTCKACGLSFRQSRNKSGLEAAHILNVEEVEEARERGGEEAERKLIRSVGLIGAGQLDNLISLCKQCHNDYFDQYKICINYDKEQGRYFWEVKDEFLDDDMPEQQGKYRIIKGQTIDFSRNGPPIELVEHRLKIYGEGTGNKRKRKIGVVSSSRMLY